MLVIAEIPHRGMPVEELEEVQLFDRQHVLGLHRPAKVGMIEYCGTAGLDRFVDVLLNDLGAVLVVKVPRHEAVHIHGRAVYRLATSHLFARAGAGNPRGFPPSV